MYVMRLFSAILIVQNYTSTIIMIYISLGSMNHLHGAEQAHCAEQVHCKAI